MGFRVQVESAQLRTGAGKMKELANEAKQIPDKAVRDAKTTDSANRGFMTGEACEALADDLKQDMQELSRHLDDTSKGLKDTAKDWDDVDEAMGKDFDSIGSDLSGFKTPTIPGGA